MGRKGSCRDNMQRVASLQSSNTRFHACMYKASWQREYGYEYRESRVYIFKKCQVSSAQGNGGRLQEEMEKLRAACCE